MLTGRVKDLLIYDRCDKMTPSDLHTHSFIPCGVHRLWAWSCNLLWLIRITNSDLSRGLISTAHGLATLKYSIMGLDPCCRKSRCFFWKKKFLGEVLEAETPQGESGHVEKNWASFQLNAVHEWLHQHCSVPQKDTLITHLVRKSNKQLLF